MSSFDALITEFDKALRAVAGVTAARRPNPADAGEGGAGPVLEEAQRRHAAGLMRVNHVGEVCAQALYQSQAFGARDPAVREQLAHAAREEEDHLAWCAQRLEELGSRPSLLNPLWYAGAFGLGLLAARAGDSISLGFVSETEKQVERHLSGHLDPMPAGLPAGDQRSRAIVVQMRADEEAHGLAARQAGGAALPQPVPQLMRIAAKVMTTTAYYL
ncbi:MAG: 2-polyprenyl-3-methyl-6-methoxy-1,4-benzoquinone monooxygenase [Candidatus Protistobacter heckmanni]|nr:2-polyprenyl-3-methyl-6-methoxy-1,4-benzoquinone monooxygenase [Candidatus Protistobacter heckmanni]